jgi:hypothetical protein
MRHPYILGNKSNENKFVIHMKHEYIQHVIIEYVQ